MRLINYKSGEKLDADVRSCVIRADEEISSNFKLPGDVKDKDNTVMGFCDTFCENICLRMYYTVSWGPIFYG